MAVSFRDAIARQRVTIGQRGPVGTLMWVNRAGSAAKVLLDSGDWWRGDPRRLRRRGS